MGMCPGCGQWNSLEKQEGKHSKRSGKSGTNASIEELEKPVMAHDVPLKDHDRILSHMDEIDRVLGGGIVPGSSVLLGGEPGIGKSTLLLQMCAGLASSDLPALYVSAEESLGQLRTRTHRLGLALDGLKFLAGTDTDQIVEIISQEPWSLVVIDSIQTVRCADLQSVSGGVSQVRESASRLVDAAKARGIPLVLIGHVTKDGSLAGPRALEHLVDTVLYFESDQGRSLRIVRAHKNRHGPVSEIGVFEMTANGLSEVSNPSAVFLADRPPGVSGSSVFCALRGSRPILVEVQALVGPSPVAQPRRTALGCDPNRVALLAAVLERRTGAGLAGCDLFINVAGGLNLDEPGADMAICIAILSSLHDKAVPADLAVFGEVGLAGEVRAVAAAASRATEAQRMGFGRLMLPFGNMDQVEPESSIKTMPISSIEGLVEQVLEEK